MLIKIAVFRHTEIFVQVPEILEYMVLCRPDLLCVWSRISGPVVSLHTGTLCPFQIF